MELLSPHKNAPSPDQNVNSPTHKIVPPSDQNMKTPTKNTNLTLSTDNNKKENKEENIWKAPPKIQVNIDDLLQQVKAISNQVQEHGLLFHLEEVRQDQKKRMLSVFVVDKQSCKFVMPTKDMILRQLSSLGIKVRALIAATSYAFWYIPLPTVEEAVALTRKTFENKECFFRTEYIGRQRTTVSVYVP